MTQIETLSTQALLTPQEVGRASFHAEWNVQYPHLARVVTWRELEGRIWGNMAHPIYNDVLMPEKTVDMATAGLMEHIAGYHPYVRPGFAVHAARIESPSLHLIGHINKAHDAEIQRLPANDPAAQYFQQSSDTDLLFKQDMAPIITHLWDNLPTLMPLWGLVPDDRFSGKIDATDEIKRWVATRNFLHYEDFTSLDPAQALKAHQQPLIVEMMRGQVRGFPYFQIHWAVPYDVDHTILKSIWTVFGSELPRGEGLDRDARHGTGVSLHSNIVGQLKPGVPAGHETHSSLHGNSYIEFGEEDINKLRQLNVLGPAWEHRDPEFQAEELWRTIYLAVHHWDLPTLGRREEISIKRDDWPIEAQSIQRAKRVMRGNKALYRTLVFSPYIAGQLTDRARILTDANPYLTLHAAGELGGRHVFPFLSALPDYKAFVKALPICVPTPHHPGNPPEDEYWQKYHKPHHKYRGDSIHTLTHTKQFKAGIDLVADALRSWKTLHPTIRDIGSNYKLVSTVFTPYGGRLPDGSILRPGDWRIRYHD